MSKKCSCKQSNTSEPFGLSPLNEKHRFDVTLTKNNKQKLITEEGIE